MPNITAAFEDLASCAEGTVNYNYKNGDNYSLKIEEDELDNLWTPALLGDIGTICQYYA